MTDEKMSQTPAITLGPSKSFSGNTPEERVLIFQDCFERDLETWFSSSIACCDLCHDGFVEQWPGTKAHDKELETGSISMDSFIAGSRLQADFFPAEIVQLREYLTCPNCDEVLRDNFYVYEHPFSVPRSFSVHRSEIAEIAKKYPFLLLSHPFARSVFDTINRLGQRSIANLMSDHMFRARQCTLDVFDQVESFGSPPAELVAEGRFNHAGYPMLYLANTASTALREIAEKGRRYQIAEIIVKTPLKILDLMPNRDYEGSDEELMQLLAHSSLTSSPRTGAGWRKPEYVFTRFLADCSRMAGFDAIKYGSTKADEAFNVVVLEPQNVHDQLKLVAISTSD